MVESDTNVPGGESLVRQILYGKRFFQQEFGQEMKSLWMPDVFGYTASLPQILKKSGVDYMMTQKLSWSEYNRYPHHSFFWEGIDGSKVLTHMPPEDTYNSPAAPRSIAKAEREYLDKNVSQHALMLFGIGDGGGGPGEEHLERLSREKNLLGLAQVEQVPSFIFFERLEQEAEHFKSWRGELYLEKHQGTLTSQARNKRYNRKLEKALRELEFASVLAHVALGRNYPQETLETIWKEVLLYQFHDILPGSSIKRVYDESLERYEALLEQTETLIKRTYEALSQQIAAVQPSTAGIALFNSLPWERIEWIEVNGYWQQVRIPAMGHTIATAPTGTDNDAAIATSQGKAMVRLLPQTEEMTLENDMVRVRFASNGTIASIVDKEVQREIISPGGQANHLRVYHDDGDAWDFNHDYAAASGQELALMHVEQQTEGKIDQLIFHYRYGESELVQTVSLKQGRRRIDFATKVDWRERGKMLRTSFPLDIRTEQVVGEIQFGSISRPTHRNTMWDFAKDEICAHQWIDLSEPDYGVALLNDCKYGHRAYDNVLDLNLLRSSGYPDPEADLAEHRFTYSLFPHPGNHVEAEVYKQGHELNVPLRIVNLMETTVQAEIDRSLPASHSWFTLDDSLIMVESVKRAEDNGDIILRLYETSGTRLTARLRIGFAVVEVWSVDLMEQPLSPLA
nr:glycoside hydrolase family 38 C-terminal domain-containing protein [Paenibacillus sp. JCM 10914]